MLKAPFSQGLDLRCQPREAHGLEVQCLVDAAGNARPGGFHDGENVDVGDDDAWSS